MQNSGLVYLEMSKHPCSLDMRSRILLEPASVVAPYEIHFYNKRRLRRCPLPTTFPSIALPTTQLTYRSRVCLKSLVSIKYGFNLRPGVRFICAGRASTLVFINPSPAYQPRLLSSPVLPPSPLSTLSTLTNVDPTTNDDPTQHPALRRARSIALVCCSR
ncbi:hypothetical protein AG1IA_06085 [Rhizoctonia solani AG-1 IA]|uniref:Uncharacterized protein n=1 Tax=Thanatephorus cucumeris (strain AG1-IA) TaxID=983506 RepID=L8WPH9_THACA|nr:hypothetical protein AG1IA_06085 [Rhizoctonia solani AG-1 IA]